MVRASHNVATLCRGCPFKGFGKTSAGTPEKTTSLEVVFSIQAIGLVCNFAFGVIYFYSVFSSFEVLKALVFVGNREK